MNKTLIVIAIALVLIGTLHLGSLMILDYFDDISRKELFEGKTLAILTIILGVVMPIRGE